MNILIKNKLQKNIKHGLSKHRIYGIWYNMKCRCLSKTNISYNRYGGRGIIIYKDWLSNFINFYKWSIDNGYSSNLQLDRINVRKWSAEKALTTPSRRCKNV